MNTLREFSAEKLSVKVYETRNDMGKAAATEMAAVLRRLLKEKCEVNIIFASAPSQNEFLDIIVNTSGIEWERVNAFHLDEYIGLDKDAPQGFGKYLRDKIFTKLNFKTVNYLNGNSTDLEAECERYANLLKKYPADIICIGTGENGHIAFNDPHVALFNDTKMVKVVELDPICRQQQVNDGCFESITNVPKRALTLTIPILLSAKNIFCIVPGETKADAVSRIINGSIDESCPASILKTHDNAILYLDKDSSKGI